MSDQVLEFPAPIRDRGRLIWDRHDIENYKRSLLGLPPLERDPNASIVFVTAKQISEELPYGRRTIAVESKGAFRARLPDQCIEINESRPRLARTGSRNGFAWRLKPFGKIAENSIKFKPCA
jgi:hypothetical protein